MPSPPISFDVYQKIQELHAQGHSQRGIAIALGISQAVVHKWIHFPYPAKDYTVDVPVVDSTSQLASGIFSALSRTRKRWSAESLSDQFNVGISKIRDAVQELQREGRNVQVLDNEIELVSTIRPSEPARIDVSKFKGQQIRFGLTSDNHLCSKYARMDVLNALYDIWKEQGITEVYQCGNMVDGEAPFNKYDLLVHGMKEQVDYLIENWPQREGMITNFITADDHEGWWVQREGVDIGQFMQLLAEKSGRQDMKFIGHMEQDIHFTGKKTTSVMRLVHSGGGSAYAVSYKTQKYVESLQGGEKPHILLVGHYHKANFDYSREVLTIQAGCTKDQDPFLRKRQIQCHVGGWTVSFELDENGIIHAFIPQWHPFYDRDFYKKWGYRWK